jgi:hypothetical protein
MAGDRTSVYAMVHQVLADSKKKLEEGQTKVASSTQRSAASHTVSGRRSGFSKIADACDRLAECIHLVNDDRSPREKLAEYAAIHQALTKRAFDVGNDAPKEPSLSAYQGTGNKGEHQDQEAEGSSQPPVSVPLDDGSPNPGGPDSALLAVPAMTPGESLDAGESGEATDAHQSPDEVTPNESPQPLDAANALETNQDMMMPEQPEDVLKQSAAMRKHAYMRALSKQADLSSGNLLNVRETGAATPGELQGERAGRRVGAVSGLAAGALGGAALGAGVPLAARDISPMFLTGLHPEEARNAAQLLKRAPFKTLAALGSVGGLLAGGALGTSLGRGIGGNLGLTVGSIKGPSQFDKTSSLKKASSVRKLQIMAKIAEDALNPAQIEAGTEPELQSADGIPNQLSQGSEVGELTPRETAPNVGEGSGRELLSSIEAAINATKSDAKGQNKGPLSEVLTEPAMSEAHDETLAESLDNTDSAGVKISSAQVSAARELLRRYINSAPGNAMKVAAILKMSADGADAADIAPGGGGAPMPTGGEMTSYPTDAEVAPMEEEGVGEVSEEALAAASQGVTPEEVEQAQQLLAMQELAGGMEGQQEAPAAGAENMEVTSQMGGMGMSSQPTPSPWSGGGM